MASRRQSELVLVATQTSGDTKTLRRILAEVGIDTRDCSSLDALADQIAQAAAAIIAEERLTDGARARLVRVLNDQPEWSDVPLIVMASPQTGRRIGWQALQQMISASHAVVLERPVRKRTLVTCVQAAIQSRRRQWEIADELARRRQAEDTLKESEARFRLMADELPLIVWVHKPDGELDFVNRTYCEFFGITWEEAIAGAWRDLSHPDDHQYVSEFLACNRERRPFHAFIRAKRADGQWRWMESWGQPRFSAAGEYLGQIGASADITSRKEAEAALHRSEERFRLAAEAVSGIIYEYDIATNHVTRSMGVYELLGYQPDEIPATATWWWEQVHPDDRANLKELHEKSLAAEGKQANEYRVRHKNGHYIHVWDRFLLTRDVRGNPQRLFGCTVDVSHRKQIELELMSVNEKLERRVAARTAEIRAQNEDLQRLAADVTQAEHRERARLSRMLHDGLQQLLVAVKMQLSVLGMPESGPYDEEAGAIMELIDESIQAARSLSYELLPPKLEDGHLGEAVQWLAEWFEENHHHQVEVAVAGDFPPMQQDVKLLVYSVVRELLLNSVKHSGVHAAGVRLYREADGRCSVEVSDQGCGFEASRVEDRTEDHAGFGLISIRRRLAALGGSLAIASAVGEGARFTVRVPAAELAAESSTVAESAAVGSQGNTRRYR